MCVYVCIYVCMCVYICMYVCMYVCACMCVYVCMYAGGGSLVVTRDFSERKSATRLRRNALSSRVNSDVLDVFGEMPLITCDF